VLTLEALADGCMDAGVVLRFESLKGEAHRDAEEIAAHQAKIERTLDMLEAEPHWMAGGGLNAGTLALACAIEWLIFRDLIPYPLIGRPQIAHVVAELGKLPGLMATRPAG
jgi:glutathione S-transferase